MKLRCHEAWAFSGVVSFEVSVDAGHIGTFFERSVDTQRFSNASTENIKTKKWVFKKIYMATHQVFFSLHFTCGSWLQLSSFESSSYRRKRDISIVWIHYKTHSVGYFLHFSGLGWFPFTNLSNLRSSGEMGMHTSHFHWVFLDAWTHTIQREMVSTHRNTNRPPVCARFEHRVRSAFVFSQRNNKIYQSLKNWIHQRKELMGKKIWTLIGPFHILFYPMAMYLAVKNFFTITYTWSICYLSCTCCSHLCFSTLTCFRNLLASHLTLFSFPPLKEDAKHSKEQG